jgi:AraC-like DNA-binding protein
MATHTSFVAGLTQSPVRTEMDGHSHGMQVNLTPIGARRLLGIPMHEVADRIVPLEEILGPTTPLLVERLHEAPHSNARFDLLDAELMARLDGAPEPTPAAEFAWNRLVETRGRASARSLSEALGCSGRYLAGQLRDAAGLAPKTAARLLRFEHALELIGASPCPDLGLIAHRCGYYDHSHLNHDFREFAGLAPTAFLRSPRSVSG